MHVLGMSTFFAPFVSIPHEKPKRMRRGRLFPKEARRHGTLVAYQCAAPIFRSAPVTGSAGLVPKVKKTVMLLCKV